MYKIKLKKGIAPFPDYRQVPVLLWGNDADFDSMGDCKYPADRDWTELDISLRPLMKERVSIYKMDEIFVVESNNQVTAQLVALFLMEWSGCDIAEFDSGEFKQIREVLINEHGFLDKWELASNSKWKYATKDNPYPK
jgi:hypothetical protein